MQEDLHSIAIEKAIPAASEKLRMFATQQAVSDRIHVQKYHELFKEVKELQHELHEVTCGV
jgi:hypothetical protein